MKRRREAVAFGRNDPNTRTRWGDDDTETKEKKDTDAKPASHPLHIGKARSDEETEQQCKAAELGIVPKISFRLLMSGPSSSGKTNAARWLIDKYYKKCFDRIILMSPTADIDPVWKDLRGLKKKDRISKMSMRPIKRLMKTQEADVKKNGKRKCKKTLIIFDDAVGDNKIINSPEFLQAFIRGRHFCCSCIVMTQSYTKIPRAVRLQATALFVFPSFKSEIERLYDEHGPVQLSKSEFFEMVQSAIQRTPDEQFPFFFIDTTQPVADRYRRCLHSCIPIDENRNPRDEKEARREAKKRKKPDDDPTAVLEHDADPLTDKKNNKITKYE